MNSFNVTVALDQSVQGPGTTPRVEVDLVGVNVADLPAWTDKSMTEYFTPGDPMRNSADKYLMVLEDPTTSKTMTITDPKWDIWKKKGALYLFVLSSYPRQASDESGDKDPRRRIIPLDCSRWGNEKDLSILVNVGGLAVQTPPSKPPS